MLLQLRRFSGFSLQLCGNCGVDLLSLVLRPHNWPGFLQHFTVETSCTLAQQSAFDLFLVLSVWNFGSELIGVTSVLFQCYSNFVWIIMAFLLPGRLQKTEILAFVSYFWQFAEKNIFHLFQIWTLRKFQCRLNQICLSQITRCVWYSCVLSTHSHFLWKKSDKDWSQ